MKKCPRCEHVIKDDEKFCPHCGLDLQGRYKPINKQSRWKKILLYLFVFGLCMSLPIAFERFNSYLLGDEVYDGKKSVELKELIDEEPTSLLAVYSTLADYNSQFSNVDEVVKNIQNYEKNLENKSKHAFDKDYKIIVFDNYNVYYTMTYTTKLTNYIDLKIEKKFDRAHQVNEEKYMIKKSYSEDFEELFLNESEQSLINEYIDSKKDIQQLMNNFYKRRDEFEQKKKHLGHYGIGEYDGQNSYVVYHSKQGYYSKLTYVKTLKNYLD